MTLNKNETGSILILVMIGVIILSMIGVMGLNKTKTEIKISRNYYSDKTAFFAAESGINIGKNILRNSLDPSSVVFGPVQYGRSSFRSGKMYDEDGNKVTAPEYIIPFTAFPSPPPTGMTLDPNMGLFLTSWELSVTAENSETESSRKSRKELVTTVAILLSEY